MEHWWTPRGPLGGYVMAIVHRGMELARRRPRPPAALAQRVLPATAARGADHGAPRGRAGGPLAHHAQRARLEQDGKLIALGVAALLDRHGRARCCRGADARGRPARPAARRQPQAAARREPPPFMGRLTMQRRFGDPAFSGSEHARHRRLARDCSKSARSTRHAARCSPTRGTRHRGPPEGARARADDRDQRALFRAPLPLPDSLLLGRFHTRLVRDGFFDEQGELWAPDGTLVAQSRQLALLIPTA